MRIGVHQAFRVRDVHCREHVEGALECLFRVHALVDHGDFHELGRDGQARIEGGHGLLVDHGDVLAADPPDLLLGQLGHVPALELDGAADDAAVLPHVAHDAVGHRGLAAPGLTHQAHRLALLDGEVEVHDRGDFPGSRVVAEPEAGDFEDRRLVVVIGHQVSPGASISRRRRTGSGGFETRPYIGCRVPAAQDPGIPCGMASFDIPNPSAIPRAARRPAG